MTRRRGTRTVVLLFVATALGMIGVSTASAVELPLTDAKVTYSTGSPCGSGSTCELIVQDVNHSNCNQDVYIDQDAGSYLFSGISYPAGNTHVSNVSITVNRQLGYCDFWQTGDSINAWARQACPGGGYHFGPTHSWTLNRNNEWWAGIFQLGSGCQT
jgi:hypothetical protein